MRNRERYLRPNNYTISVPIFGAGVTINLAPNKMRIPVKSFLVQADLVNTGIVNVGNGAVSLTVGVQLDPGRAWVFSVTENLPAGSLYQTPLAFAEVQPYMQPESPVDLFLDIADYFATATVAAQLLHIIWFTSTAV